MGVEAAAMVNSVARMGIEAAAMGNSVAWMGVEAAAMGNIVAWIGIETAAMGNFVARMGIEAAAMGNIVVWMGVDGAQMGIGVANRDVDAALHGSCVAGKGAFARTMTAFARPQRVRAAAFLLATPSTHRPSPDMASLHAMRGKQHGGGQSHGLRQGRIGIMIDSRRKRRAAGRSQHREQAYHPRCHRLAPQSSARKIRHRMQLRAREACSWGFHGWSAAIPCFLRECRAMHERR